MNDDNGVQLLAASLVVVGLSSAAIVYYRSSRRTHPDGTLLYQDFSRAPSFLVHLGYSRAVSSRSQNWCRRRFEVRVLAPQTTAKALVHAEAASLVDAEWTGSGASITRGVVLSQRSMTLILGLFEEEAEGSASISERQPRSSPGKEAAVMIAAYVRVDEVPANVMAAHWASSRCKTVEFPVKDMACTDECVMVVSGLVVRPSLRGALGLGRHLMSAAARVLPPDSHVYLSCFGSQLARFYESCGFIRLGKEAGLPTGFTSIVGASGDGKEDGQVIWLYKQVAYEGSQLWRDLPRLGYS